MWILFDRCSLFPDSYNENNFIDTLTIIDIRPDDFIEPYDKIKNVDYIIHTKGINKEGYRHNDTSTLMAHEGLFKKGSTWTKHNKKE